MSVEKQQQIVAQPTDQVFSITQLITTYRVASYVTFTICLITDILYPIL